MPEDEISADRPDEAPLSLSRLRQAFASMLGEQGSASKEDDQLNAPETPLPARCDVNPRSVVEAMLFVGRPDNGPHSPRELAAAMRGVSPSEVDAVVSELNSLYESDEAPYHIEKSGAGYRLVLRDEFARMRDKFYGRLREAKLSPATMEVLAIIAYNQPITSAQIDQLRGAPNGALLSSLVRRRLARLDRPDDGQQPQYSTTQRFLKLFGLENLAALPRSEELEKG